MSSKAYLRYAVNGRELRALQFINDAERAKHIAWLRTWTVGGKLELSSDPAPVYSHTVTVDDMALLNDPVRRIS